ncbi:MAG: UvrD-helicase domain-containing protein, partial [Oscillospiraceae bacterium]|nr:UvrD-helicase domain-containing protein [Oscillospiraceae bacterium]
MAQFNKQQAAAVNASNPYLLCSAGAGSGKTTVMVASVAHKLMTDPDKSISTFLIITFTNEAAANMRRTIRDKFAEDREKGLEYAKRGLADLENASISTIHAFCKGLISSYFYAVEGMSPKFEIIEEARLEQIFREAYEEALDSIFAEDSTFPSEERELVREVMDSFTQAELVTMCRALYKSLMGISDPFEHLDGYIDSITLPGEENPWVQEIMFAVDMDLQGLEDFIRQEEDMLCDITPQKCADAAQADRDAVYALLDRLAEGMTAEEMIDALHAANEGMPTVRGKIDDEAKEWNEEFKALRNTVKGSKGVLMTSAKRLENLVKAGQLADNERIQRTLRGISVILRTAAANFRRMKLDMQGIDYSDMEQMAYELIKREDIRRAVREDITDIYVDECQDVSAIQYAIIDALSGGEGRTVCRVGDIKQSIYGFRSAAPDLMERDIQSYSDDEDAQRRKIFFSENYRSCEQVIACVNEVFDTSMDRRISEIDYTPEDHLHANVSGEFGPVRVELITREEGYDVLESQCEAAGRIIRELVEKGRRYGDIVILVRNARSDAEMMVEYFRRQHIPVLYDGAANFYGLTEISSFLSLLTVIDNDHTDTEIIGALKNVPFSFTDEELGMIRQAKQDRSWYYEAFRFCCDRGETPLDLKCSAARDRIMRWRESARTMKISDFIWTLMRESGIYAVRGA